MRKLCFPLNLTDGHTDGHLLLYSSFDIKNRGFFHMYLRLYRICGIFPIIKTSLVLYIYTRMCWMHLVNSVLSYSVNQIFNYQSYKFKQG